MLKKIDFKLSKILSIILAVAIVAGCVPAIRMNDSASAAAGDLLSLQIVDGGVMTGDSEAIECSVKNDAFSIDASGKTGADGIWKTDIVIGDSYAGTSTYSITVDGTTVDVEKDLSSAEQYFIYDIKDGSYSWSETAVDTVKLVSVGTVADITGVENGSAKSVSGLGLPETVALTTSPSKALEADIDWDVTGCSYDAYSKTAQEFTVSGTVELPSNVVNTNNVSLDVSVNVKVNAGADAKFTTQPESEVSLAIGETLTLKVRASNADEDTYQWYKDGVKLDGQTDKELEIIGVTMADAGSYTCKVTGVNGVEITSDAAAVSVNKVNAVLKLESNLASPQKRPVTAGIILTATGIEDSASGKYVFYVNDVEKQSSTSNKYTFVPDTAENNYTFKVVFEGDDKYEGAEATLAFVLEKSEQQAGFAITGELSNKTEIVYGESNNSYTVSNNGTGSGKGKVVYAVVDQTDLDGNPADDIASIDSETGSLKINKAGKFAVTAMKLGDDDYLDGPVSKTSVITVKKADQTGFAFANPAPEKVVFNAGDNTFTNAADGGAGDGEVTYAIKEGADVAELTDAKNGTIKFKTAGVVTVAATKAEDDRYNAATAEYTLEIEKAEQKIEFAKLPEEGKDAIEVYYGQDFENKADAVAVEGAADGKGYGEGEITYTVESGDAVLKVEDGKVVFNDTAVGTVVIKAAKAECVSYKAAEATYTLNIIEKTVDGVYYKSIEGEQNEDGNGWYTSDVTITPLDGYKISTSKSREAAWEDKIVISAEGEANETVIYLRDETGAIVTAGCTIAAEDLKIDKEDPTELSVTYSGAHWYDDIENVIFFGKSDTPIKVTLSAKDTTSKIANFDWSFTEDIKGEKLVPDSAENSEVATVDVILPLNDIEQIRGQISFTARDNAGRTSSMTDERTLVYDAKNPELSIEYDGEFYGYFNKADNTLAATETDATYRVYKDSVSIKINASEDNFKDDPSVTVNGSTKDCEWTEDGTNRYTVIDFTEGTYSLEVNCTDITDNSADTLKADFVVDSGENSGIDIELSSSAEPKDGKYYTDNVTAKITVEDKQFNFRNASFSIVSAVDQSNNPVDISTDFAAVLADEKNWIAEGDNKYSVTVTLSNEAVYTIMADYKNVIGNVVSVTSDEFVVDKTAPDADMIEISYDSTSVKNKLYDAVRAITFNYYQAPVEVTVKAKDLVSGIESITLSYAKADDASSVNSNEWTETSTDISYGENGEATAVFTVSDADVQHDGLFTASATDKAGLSSSDKNDTENRVVVDTISPERTVEYGNIKNIVDETTGEYLEDFSEGDAVDVYYSGDATVTFTVNEANFYSEDINASNADLKDMNCSIKVSKDGGEATEVTPDSWTKNGDEYTGSITLSGDGRYVVTMDYSDRSTNAMATYTSPELIIDTAAPVISTRVENSASARNGIYYNPEAILVVSVNETNFNAEELTLGYTAKDAANNDVALTDTEFEAKLRAAEWTEVSKDVHEAKITLSENARYIFTLGGKDLATNEAAEHISAEIVVDTVKPDSEDITIDYSKSFFSTVIDLVTFNYYNAPVDVTVGAKDAVAGIESIALSYARAENASEINLESWTKTIEAADFESAGNGEATAVFTVTENELDQLNGHVTATATDMAGNKSEEATDAETRVVVDNINPVLNIEYDNVSRHDGDNVLFGQSAVVIFNIDEANFYGEDINVKDNCNITVTKYSDEFKTEEWTKEYTPAEWTKNGDINTGKITIDMADGEQLGWYTATIKYTDRSGNVMEEATTKNLILDVEAAVVGFEIIRAAEDNGKDKYYQKNPILKITLEEQNFDATKVDVTVTAKDFDGNELALAEDYNAYFSNESNWTSDGRKHEAEIEIAKDAHYEVVVYYTDTDGTQVKNENEIIFVVDNVEPEDLAIEYGEETLISSILRAVTFNYYNPDVKVIVTVNDETAGIEAIRLSYTRAADASTNDVESWEETVYADSFVYTNSGSEKAVKAEFTIPAADAEAAMTQYNGHFTAQAVDKAGNISELADEGRRTVVDSISPTRSVAIEFERAFDELTNKEITGDAMKNIAEGDKVILFSKSDVTLTFTVNEANFYPEDVNATDAEHHNTNCKIIVNKNGKDEYMAPAEWTKNGDVYTGSITLKDDADYYVTMQYTDASGNEMKTYKSQHIVVDGAVPVIEVEYDNYSASNDKYYNAPRTATIKVIERYMLARDVKFKFTAKDVTGAPVNITTDYNKYLQQDSSWTKNGDVYEAKITFDQDAHYNFTFDCADMAGNKAEAFNSGDFVVDQTLPQNLKISYSYSNFRTVINSITFLYFNPSVTVTLTAEDATAGVDHFDWAYYRESGASSVNASSERGTITDLTYSEGGRVARGSFDLPEGDTVEQYRGNISFTATDRANNESDTFEDEETVIVVDTISPTRTVEFSPAKNVVVKETNEVVDNLETYDYTTEGEAYKFIYDGESSATITINEANFYPEDVEIKINDADADEIDWKNSGDIWTGVVTFPTDGHYVLTMEYTDRSDNEMVEYVSNEIIVDTVDPVIEVTYSPDNAVDEDENGKKYYNVAQTATIKITEHNFRAEDVIVTVNATDISGADVESVDNFNAQLKNSSNWTTVGDVHTATIDYNVDANYDFTIEYTDLAGRKAADYERDLFVVDTTGPEITDVKYSSPVSEDGNTKYYNGKVTVTVTVDDPTSGANKITYKGTTVDAKTVTEESSGGTTTFIFEVPEGDIKNNQFNDKIDITAYDRAGNSSDERKGDSTLVVDTIAPNATITYNDATTVNNGISYYSGDIVATIRVDEANFYAEDVQVFVNGTARGNVSWNEQGGNIHQGTFSISEDGDYVVSVKYKDRSNNAMADYESEQLTIDRTKPTLSVSGINHETAYNGEKVGFVLRAEDTNLNGASLKPVLTAIVQGEDGEFVTKTIPLGSAASAGGQAYTISVDNLEEDAVYTLTCTATDLAGNENNVMYISESGAQRSDILFSVNRNGSAYMINEYTKNTVEEYYMQSVDEDIVIVEVNVDPLEKYEVELNGEVLVEGVDYTVEKTGGNGSWNKYSYSIKASNFETEGEYTIVVTSVDRANAVAYSDIKGAKVKFVVDKTAPVVTVSGIEKDGRYKTDKQSVTVMVSDDGGELASLKIVVNGTDVKHEYSGEELMSIIEANGGMLSFEISESSDAQSVSIICVDKAGNVYDSGDTYTNITVSPSTWIILWANPVFRWGLAGGAVAVAAAIFFIILFKRKKKEEKAK